MPTPPSYHSYTGHAENPLTPDEWNKMRAAVIESATRHMVGRRIIDVYGPLGPGVQSLPFEQFADASLGTVDLIGEKSEGAVVAESRRFKPIPMIHKDFVLHWRDLEASRGGAFPLDVSAAAGAASLVARAEDRLIFFGNAELGYDGLMNAQGRSHVEMRSWERTGGGFENVVEALEVLLAHGHYGPYAMAASPKRFAQLHRVYEKTGVLEIDSIKKVVTEGIFQSTVLTGDQAVVIAVGSEHFDLAVSVDVDLAYLGAEKMNHPFRVLECVALRIKHPDAICTFEAGPQRRGKG
ncbi:MAG: family 1 encapsulin nanocompartment shell protein [Myxococcota bacterium]